MERDELPIPMPTPHQRMGSAGSGETAKVRHKFGAIRTEVDGIKFASKREANYFLQLRQAQRSGDLLFFLRQAPFHLPGGVRYVVDFVEFWKSGEVRFVDCKGFATQVYITKRKIVEALYPIKIIEV